MSTAKIQEVSKIYFSIFVLFGILFVPFSWNIFSFQSTITEFLFAFFVEIILKATDSHWVLMDFSSDSKSLYVLLCFLMIISLIPTIIVLKLNETFRAKMIASIASIASIYLSFILFKYGFDKLFKTQFYLPEPNLLYTPLGNLDKDILFWSTMGSSYSYNIFMGCMEILPAILLLFQRTRILGAFIASGIMINVVAINFSFDISVKLFSSFLLLLALFISWKGIRQIFELFILKKNVKPAISSANFSQYKNYYWIKSLVVLFVLAEALFPYLNSGYFNDDEDKRPFLHGAYEVLKDANNHYEASIKKVFIHRDGYLIFQDKKDQMTDYKLSVDQNKQKMHLTDYNGKTIILSYSLKEKILILRDFDQDKSISIKAKMLDWRELPLLQGAFHWCVD